MKYTILGFSQKKALELNLSAKELMFLRWFIDFMVTLKMKYIIVNEITYFWVDSKTVIEELPLLRIREAKNMRRFLKKMVDKGILTYFIHKGYIPYYTVNKEIMQDLLTMPPQPRTRGKRGHSLRSGGGTP